VISLQRVRPSNRLSPPSSLLRFVLTTFGSFGIISCASPPSHPVPIVEVPIASVSATSLSPETPLEPTAKRPSGRMWTWETDVFAARTRAKRDHVPLVVYVRADWSAASLEMDRNVWSDPRILFHPRAVVPLRIDVTDGPDAELWAQEFAVRAIPAAIFFDAEGRETKRFEGVTSVDDVIGALRQIEEETTDR
jgi:thiol:disulfide interchange protein